MIEEFTAPNPDYAAKTRQVFDDMTFLSDFMKVELAEVGPGRTVLQVPFRTDLSQQDGFFNGGVMATMADNGAGLAAYSLAPKGVEVLAAEFKINLLRPANGELLIARSYAIKPGRMLCVCRSDLFILRDGGEKLCAAAQGTFAYLDTV